MTGSLPAVILPVQLFMWEKINSLLFMRQSLATTSFPVAVFTKEKIRLPLLRVKFRKKLDLL